jgi:hypothetical protein
MSNKKYTSRLSSGCKKLPAIAVSALFEIYITTMLSGTWKK